MIDVYQTRRTYNLKCTYYKHDKKNNDALEYDRKPDGVFYAKRISSADSENKEISNVFKFTYNTLTIETRDKVNVDKDDLVYIQGSKWIVMRVNNTELLKNTEFSIKPSKTTVISLRK